MSEFWEALRAAKHFQRILEGARVRERERGGRGAYKDKGARG